MTDNAFTVLIGSCARGTADRFSDVDVVRIDHSCPLTHAERAAAVVVAEGPISYIDYDAVTFSSLHASGSLFVFHILFEGRLLRGSTFAWARLREDFTVCHDFRSNVEEYRELCYWLSTSRAFLNATLPRLSHMFRALKNLAIFRLAARRQYVFDKREAIGAAFPTLAPRDVRVLMAAYQAFERGLTLPHLDALALADGSVADLCSRVSALLVGLE